MIFNLKHESITSEDAIEPYNKVRMLLRKQLSLVMTRHKAFLR